MQMGTWQEEASVSLSNLVRGSHAALSKSLVRIEEGPHW